MFIYMKSILVCLAAVLAVSAVTSSAASAAQVKIKGTNFNGSETIESGLLLLEFGGVQQQELQLQSKLPGGNLVRAICSGLRSIAGFIWNHVTVSVKLKSVIYSGCAVTAPTCKLGNSKGEIVSTITLNANTGTVEEMGGKLFVNFIPDSGTTFTEITLLECAGEGKFVIAGAMRARILTNFEELLKGINFNATSGTSLKFGVEPATITGLVGLTLNGTNKGSVWGVN